MRKPFKYWNLDTIYLHAKECKTRTEFKLKYYGGYELAIKLNIIDKLGFERNGDREHRCIYVCEFEDKSAYIGLTFNYKSRVNEHLNKSHKSSIKDYIIKNPDVRYTFKQITEYIDKESASIKEGEFVEIYKNNGWNILNRSKTGTLGSPFPSIIFEELKLIFAKYSNYKELINSSDYKFYCVAKKRGLLKDLHYKGGSTASRFKWKESEAFKICNKYNSLKGIKCNKLAFSAFRYLEGKRLTYKLKYKLNK